MSDTTRLGVSITASDTAAATIKQLEATVRGLRQTLQDVGGTAADVGGKITAALEKEISSINREITARGGQATAIRTVTAALKEQAEAAAVVHRTLQEGIEASFGVGAQQQIKSASESARVLATSLSAAAEADARLRNEALAAAAALERQGAAVKTLSGEQFFGMFQRRMGMGQQPLSAELMAAQMQQRLGPAGGGITLTPAAGFGQRLSDMGKVNLAYKSAAESAKVFQAAGVSAAEAVLLANVKMATSVETQVSGVFTRMIRHIVSLFDSLARGQRGQAMSSIGAMARDSGAGVMALTTSVGGLLAVMGTAAIFHHAEALGKWATETRAMAAASGMSVQDLSSMQGALKLTGMGAEDANTTIKHFAQSLSQALADPTSKAAEAFHNLGIMQDTLVKNGPNVSGGFDLLADAMTRTVNDGSRASNVLNLLGRNAQKAMPAIQDGAQHFESLRQAAIDAGIIIDEKTSKSLEELGSHLDLISAKIEGGVLQAFAHWKPGIEAVADTLVNFIGIMGKVIDLLGMIAIAPVTIPLKILAPVVKAGEGAGLGGTISTPQGQMVMVPGYGLVPATGEVAGVTPAATVAKPDIPGMPKVAVPPLTTPVSQEAQRNLQMATAEAAASKGGSRTAELQAGIKVLQEWIAKDKEGSKEMIADRTALANKQKELNNELASAGKTAAKQSYADYAASEELILTKARGNSAEIKAIYDDWINTAISKYHQLGKVVDQLRAKELEAVNAAKRGEIMQRVKTDEQAATLKDLNDRLAAFQSGTAPVRGQKLGPTGDIEQAQQYIAQAQQVDAQYKEQTASLKQYGATAEQVVALETQAKSKEVALYEKAAEASQKAVEKVMEPWTKLFDNIGSEFEGLTSSILSAVISPQITLLKEGLTTKRVSESGNQIGAAFRKMLLDGISSAANSVQTALGHMLANALSGGQANTLGELLSQKLTQGLTAIFPSLAGSLGGAAGAAGTAGATTAATTALGAFTTALGGATAALTGHTGVTVTNAGATVANTGATATDTIATVTSSGATAVNTVGTTVNTASTAVNTTGIFAHTGAILLSTVSFVGNTIATVANTIATIINSIASNPIGALAMVGGVAFGMSKMERGGIVPSAAGGMMVGGTGASLAILHAREMVLPAPISMGLQTMIQKNTGGGGPTNTASLNYAPTINTGSRSRGGTGMSRGEFSQLLALHSGAMLGEARNMMRNGWRP